MLSKELIIALGFTAPIISALVCMVLVWLGARDFRETPRRRLHYLMAGTYFVAALCWLGLVLYITDREAFVYYHPIFLLTLMLDQVLIYRFVYAIAGTGEQKKFPLPHFIIPVAVALAAVVFACVTPFSLQAEAIYGNTDTYAENSFKYVFLGTNILFIVYNILYPVLGLVTIYRYRRAVVNYSADVQRTSLGWLSAMLVLTLVTVPVPLAGLLSGINAFTDLYFNWIGALPTFVVYLIICYNLITYNYEVIEPETGEGRGKQAATLDRERFERYLRESKPYLDPKVRITDLAAGLNSNRTYISAFINREYGMNFSRFINSLRLKELDRLYNSPKYAGNTTIELVSMAGFSSYRSYLRAKELEDRMNQVRAAD